MLGRVRRSAIADAGADHPVEGVMEPGPSTVRYDTKASELIERLAGKNLKTGIVTTPSGCLWASSTARMPSGASERTLNRSL